MKDSSAIMLIGMVMFAAGLVMFYSVETGQTEQIPRYVKNAGIFVGLAGIGAVMAGILLHLMSKSGPIRR